MSKRVLSKKPSKKLPPPDQASKSARFSGDAIRKWRRNRGLTIPRLARYLDYAPPTLYRWEAHTLRPEHPRLLRLALEHFDCRAQPRTIDDGLLESLRFWIERIARGTLTTEQLEALTRLRELTRVVQTNLADRSADNADTDADTPDSRGRWRLRSRGFDPDA